MSKLVLQYSIINDTPADAVPVEANFNRIEAHVNQEVIERAGSVAMTGQLKLAGNPVAADDAVAKGYVDLMFPIASIMAYGGAADPSGGTWMLADGRELDSASYPELFAVIGINYGSASGGRFNIPDLRDRVPLGAGPSTALGSFGGGRNAVIAPHTHPVDHTHASGNTGNTDLTHAHGDDHQHSGTTVGANARHAHQLPSISVIQYTGAPTFYIEPVGAGGFNVAATQFDLSNLNTNTDSPDHGHSFGTNFKSQQGYGTTTSNALGNHSHTVQAPTFNGASGPASGAAATAVDGNLPPYRAVNYIVKVR